MISGFALSLIYRTNIAKKPKYEWEKPEYNEEEDLFMQHFDENGNFVEQVSKPPGDLDDSTFQEDRKDESGVTYRYYYKKSDEKE